MAEYSMRALTVDDLKKSFESMKNMAGKAPPGRIIIPEEWYFLQSIKDIHFRDLTEEQKTKLQKIEILSQIRR